MVPSVSNLLYSGNKVFGISLNLFRRSVVVLAGFDRRYRWISDCALSHRKFSLSKRWASGARQQASWEVEGFSRSDPSKPGHLTAFLGYKADMTTLASCKKVFS